VTELTRPLLEAAAELLARHGFRGLRVADVATRAGVSRQTVYNEFRNKNGIVEAVTRYKTEEFLDGVRQRLADAPDPVTGLREAVEFVFRLAAKDPLTGSVLGGTHAEDMLPLITTKGHPVLASATDVFLEHIRRHWPLLPPERAELAAETIVRVVLSHLLTPGRDAVRTVEAVTAALLPLP